MSETYTIDAFDNGERLDRYLVRVNEYSRSKVQTFIKQHGVLINGETVHVPHRFLKDGDVLQVDELTDELVRKPIVEEVIAPARNANAPLPKLDILFENKDVIVIQKQAGILVHPAAHTTEPTLMDALIHHDPDIKTVGDKPEERAGIVHRLDRHVSGVMIVAKTQPAFEDLKRKFQKRYVRKKYRALVNGHLDKDEETITFKIARNKKLGRMVARPESQEGRDAVTMYKTLRKYANATEIDIDLHTGRTHQIRVHMHALGHPVVGDELYKVKNQKTISFDRLWLHAYELSLALPGEDEATTFEAPLPTVLTDLTDSLHRID